MQYGIYKNIRNASWRCLIDCDIQSLPIPISKICRIYGGKVINNSDEHNRLKLNDGESGRVYIIHDSPFVIVKETEPIGRIRFTIAHELGHYLLGHLGNDLNVLNREYENIKPPLESEADVFASRLLAPACVLWGLNLHTPQEIAEACNISLQAATIRAERMEILYKRNMFLSHPLERQVYENFREFIESNK